MLTKADTIRAAALGVRLEADDDLLTPNDWRRRYIDLAQEHWAQAQRLERADDLAGARLTYCRILYGLVVALVAGHVWRWM